MREKIYVYLYEQDTQPPNTFHINKLGVVNFEV